MTIQALTLSMRETGSGRLRGVGLVCAEVQYGAVLLAGADQPQRRFATAATWAEIQREVRLGLPSGRLPSDCALATLLTGSVDAFVVQWVHTVPLDVSHPAGIVVSLDRHLRGWQLGGLS